MIYEVIDSYERRGVKVVEVLVTVEGAEGPAQEYQEFRWSGPERYKMDPSGKQVPKTGTDYKAEISEQLEAAYYPKALSP